MLSTTESTLTHALKEWAVAVQALEAGQTIMLLRKGGIKEENKSFSLPYRRVWLYPTYEHQKPHLLKTQYASQVTPVESGWHPTEIRIGSCAEITDVFSVSNPEIVTQLEPYHIWNEQMISDRLKWKPRQPLSVLLLRVYCLPESQLISYHQAYSGCKSWIDLVKPLSLENLIPVLDQDVYNQQVKEISEIIA
ncbi:protein of unknown function DUF1802 [Stanieria cyanosphaera PCC 7437]|uniref:DUF1802 family protein n=1 Tax=Stanieria cyanosphaera (strain ATCC 29371 / PCC 7437) TaxID=111780 RepID=K9XS52_STAC7|nr:DUF1802 family protein [Stanieria cyanosphaera]AFZ34886.1 protein of unknown function DUF1802 [Stanieria cyanosphaera PCC 7437]